MGPASEAVGILTGDSQGIPDRTALHQHQLLAGETGPERPCSAPAHNPVPVPHREHLPRARRAARPANRCRR